MARRRFTVIFTIETVPIPGPTRIGGSVGDVSLFDMALHNTCYLATWYLNEGIVTGRLPRSAHPSLTPCQLYRTADGWIYLMCNKEKFWPALCEKLGRPEWSEADQTLAQALQKEMKVPETGLATKLQPLRGRESIPDEEE